MAITKMIPAVIAVRPRGQRGLPGAPGAPGDQINFTTRIAAAASNINEDVDFLRVAGYAAIGDGGGGSCWRRVSGAPTHFAWFQSADGAHWEYCVEGEINICHLGAVGNNSTPTQDAFLAAWSILNAYGTGCIYMPAGKYYFSETVDVSLTSPESPTGVSAAVTVRGDGSKATILRFANNVEGLVFRKTIFQNIIHLHGFSVHTDSVGTNRGISLMSTWVIVPTTPVSTIFDIDIRGSDDNVYGAEKYWAIGLYAKNWSFVNAISLTTCGHISNLGIGVQIEGDAVAEQYLLTWFFDKCLFNFAEYGVVLGPYWQGIGFNQCNWTGHGHGTGLVVGASTAGLLAYVTLTNCQFDMGGSSIYFGTGSFLLQASNNLFSLGRDNAVGIYLTDPSQFTIVGNVFNTYDSPANTTGVAIAASGTYGASGLGVINSNVFGGGINIGYTLSDHTERITAIGNTFAAGVTPYINIGTNPSPGIAETGHPLP